MADAIDAIVDAKCDDIATATVEAAADAAWSMVVNAGQESLVGDIQGDIYDAWDDVFNGESPPPIETSHPEAIGEICETATAILEEGASVCNDIRNAANIADLF